MACDSKIVWPRHQRLAALYAFVDGMKERNGKSSEIEHAAWDMIIIMCFACAEHAVFGRGFPSKEKEYLAKYRNKIVGHWIGEGDSDMYAGLTWQKLKPIVGHCLHMMGESTDPAPISCCAPAYGKFREVAYKDISPDCLRIKMAWTLGAYVGVRDEDMEKRVSDLVQHVKPLKVRKNA